MKKNKLYTANKWNRPAFMSEPNIFAGGGWSNLAQADKAANPWNYADDLDTTQQYMNSKGGWFGLSKKNNPFSKGNMAGIGKAMGNAALGAGASLVGGIAGNAISGGLESEAGAAISSIGGTVAGTVGAVNPVAGAIVGAGSQLVGGLVNRAFGSKLNKENIADVEKNITNIRTSASGLATASSSDDFINRAGNMQFGYDFDNDYIGKDGWFSDKASRKAAELRRKQEASRAYARNAIATGAVNVDSIMDDNIMSNFAAFGGPINTMGAIEYGFMNDYLTMKNKQNDVKNKMPGITSMPALSTFALGGDLQTNGADWSTGMMHINAGGSHETNPNDGVQLGVDNEGTPNLVEEGEVVFNDYVYSNRINVADPELKSRYHVGKKKDITYASLAKRIEKESQERPNDPISQAGLKAAMAELAEAQEIQKAEMEAARAREAFEALSPEEQTAIMQQRAMEEQAMMNQMAQEEALAQQQAMMQEQQPMQADGSQAMVGQEAPMMACGGKLYAPGGYLWDKFWESTNEYSKKKGNAKNKYAIDKTYKGNIKDLENSEAYKAFTDYILDNASDEERLKYFRWIDDNTGRERTYTNNKGELLEGWQDKYKAARNDGLYGIQHYTPEWQAAVEEAPIVSPEARVFHALEDDDDYIQGELDPNVAGDEVRRSVLPNGDTVIYHARKTVPAAAEKVTTPEEQRPEVAPVRRNEALRYAGLFGPAVGLGMMATGVGKPDYSGLDAAVTSAGNVYLAGMKPIGNYLTYRPMDIWFEQNRLNANSRATDRAILNSGANQGSKMAGLLASGYNDQIASGDLYRKALEYNDAKRKDVAEFNRGTDQFNAEAFNRLSQFNANARNQAAQQRASIALQAAREKMDADAGWYNSLYGNIGSLFKGIGDIGTENYRMNRIAEMAARGDFGSATDSTYGFENVLKPAKKKKAKGGKVNKKKGLTY